MHPHLHTYGNRINELTLIDVLIIGLTLGIGADWHAAY